MWYKQLIVMDLRRIVGRPVGEVFRLGLFGWALLFSVSLLAQSRNENQRENWLQTEPFHRNFDLQIGNEDWLQNSADDNFGGNNPQSMMAPPDPNSQIPLTGFDWMLLGSFAFGARWLVKNRDRLGTVR